MVSDFVVWHHLPLVHTRNTHTHYLGILSLCELLMASGAVLSPSPPGVATVYASATDQVPTAVVPPPNAASLRTKSPGGDSMHNEGPAHGTLAASPASPIPGAQAMSFSRLYSQISQASPDVPKQQREDIFNIQALAQHLLSLVEDLLDVSRIEAREITLDQGTVLVPEIMKRILLALQSRAKARNIDIKTHISPGACGAFIGAPSRLQQVITNLVGNAVKFSRINSTVTANITLTSSVTDAGGFGSSDHKLHTHPDEPQHFSSPSIKSSAAANANANGAAGASEARSPTGSIRRSSSKVSPTAVPPLNVLEAVCLSPRSNVPPMPAPGADEDWVTLHVSVHDQGDGIDQGNMNKLFQPFSQVDSSSQRKFQGSGLGLYICANLIKMMHGSLIVKSRVGVGSSFAFTVKLRTLAAMSQVTVVDVADSRSLLWRGTRRTASVSGAEGFAIGKSSRSGLHITRRQDSTGTQLLLQTRLARNASTGAPALMALSDETTVEMMQPLALSSPPVLLPGCLSDTPLSEAFVLHDKPVPVHSEGLLSQPVACVCASPAGAAAVAAESALEGKRQHNRGKAATSPTSRNKRAAPVRSPKTLHASAAAAAEVAKKARFLVVEDNVVNQKLAVRMLSALSALYECVTADDGEQAVALFREQCFDFVFMVRAPVLSHAVDFKKKLGLQDCQMPVMDGFGATRAIRTMEYQKAQSDAQSRDRRRVPIVALTANAMSSDRTACLEAGMDDFLAKPFSGAALEAVISRWLPLKSALPV